MKKIPARYKFKVIANLKRNEKVSLNFMVSDIFKIVFSRFIKLD